MNPVNLKGLGHLEPLSSTEHGFSIDNPDNLLNFCSADSGLSSRKTNKEIPLPLLRKILFSSPNRTLSFLMESWHLSLDVKKNPDEKKFFYHGEICFWKRFPTSFFSKSNFSMKKKCPIFFKFKRKMSAFR